jgi:hypothetical protein
MRRTARLTHHERLLEVKSPASYDVAAPFQGTAILGEPLYLGLA